MRYIGESVKILESHLADNIKIYDRVMIKKSEINEGVSLGNDTVVVNSEVGQYCEIDRRNYLHNSVIGHFTYTGWNTYIGFADIGKFCSISRDVDIGGQDHNYSAISSMPIKKILQMKTGSQPVWDKSKKVYIGNDVWIGQGVTVLKKNGITISDGAVIAAGAVVCKDIGPYEIWGGVPAKFIKYRFCEKWISKLLKIKWWDFPLDLIEKNMMLLQEIMSDDVINQLENLNKNI